MRSQKYFGVAVEKDGTFTIDSVPPGVYKLMISANKLGNSGPWPETVIASGGLDVNVSEGADPANPIQLGEILLLAQTNRVRQSYGP